MAFSFDTVFKIGAVFTGAAAMNQAQAAVTKLEQKGLLAGMNLKKMALGLGGLAAGYLTVSKLTGFLNQSIDAARRAKASYQGISDALSSLPIYQKEGAEAIKTQTKLLDNLAKNLEKTGVVASESLGAGIAQLSKLGFSTVKLYQMGDAYQDMIVRVNGVKASAEQAAATADKFGQAIKQGGETGFQALKELGILTDENRQRFDNAKDADARFNVALGEMNRHIGATSEAMKSQEGISQRFSNAWKNIQVAMGTPFMQVQDKVADAMNKVREKILGNTDRIVTAITPTINKLTDKFSEWIIKFIDNIDKYQPQIDKFGDVITKFFDWLLKNGTGVTQAVGSIAGAFALFTGFVKIAAGIKTLSGAITGVSAAVKVMQGLNIGATLAAMAPFWPILVIAALAAGIYLLVTHWKEVKKWALDAWDAIQNAWGKAGQWFNEKVGDPLGKMWQNVLEALNKFGLELNPWLLKTWGGIVTWIDQNVIVPVVNLWKNLPQRIIAAVGTVGALFQSWETGVVVWFTKSIIDPIVNLFKNLPAMIGDALKGMGGILQKIMSAAWNQMLEKLPFGWGEQFKINIPAEAPKTEAGKTQAEHTEAVKQSTDALFGKSPGFIPGLQAATKHLLAFVPALRQATVATQSMSMGGAAGGAAFGGAGAAGGAMAMSLGAGGAVAGGAAGGPSSSSMGVGGAYGGTKFTHYGYKKDSTPDWNSAHGIGDRDNKLVDRYSAALTLSERYARFGTRGHSTGKVFAFAGHQLRDDDTAPESDRRVDLYDPYSTASSAFGRLFTHPALTAIGERRPELAIPLESSGRSRNLLSAAASRIGMGVHGGAGAGATHLSMNAPITINGVAAGDVQAVGREVQRAMQDPIRHLLEQLKRARNQEQRLSYA